MIYDLYSCTSLNEIKAKFLLRLKMVIPYSYASILLHETTEDPDTIRLTTPICIPEAFTEAENEYMKVADEDHLLWLLHSREPRLVRESDLLEDQQRLNSPLYIHCYRKYNIFDSMQYASVYQQELLGILTLFRTEKDGPFTNEDMFYLQAIGMHLNAVLYQITHSLPHKPRTPDCRTDLPVPQQRRNRRVSRHPRKHPTETPAEHLPKNQRNLPLGTPEIPYAIKAVQNYGTRLSWGI